MRDGINFFDFGGENFCKRVDVAQMISQDGKIFIQSVFAEPAEIFREGFHLVDTLVGLRNDFGKLSGRGVKFLLHGNICRARVRKNFQGRLKRVQNFAVKSFVDDFQFGGRQLNDIFLLALPRDHFADGGVEFLEIFAELRLKLDVEIFD